MKTVKEVLIILYSEILESYSSKNELYILRNSMTFYEFIEKQFEKYRKLCGEIKEEELIQISRGEFKCECTQKRFMNMINRLIDAHLQILRFAYEGDYYTSFCQLENLMLSKGKLTQYMNDEYQNYIIGNVNKKILYRMRDISQNENPPESCWHVPFSNRNRASLGRYNMSGIPCLYLADSKETSDKELGVLKDGKNRWCSEFNSEKGFGVLDFSIPSNTMINNEDHLPTLLSWLLTYPLRLLCGIKTYDEGNFHEEYIFPQLVFHWMYMKPYDKRMDGFMYSSTKNPGGINYVFPATYRSKTPPTYSDKQVSEKLELLFVQSTPVLYREGKEKKKYTIEVTEV